MKKMKVDLAVIGGGPAGMAAALEAKRQGVEKVIIIERDKKLGGILQQCIHDGFGIQRFGERLAGTEYAQRFIDQIKESDIEVLLETMVIEMTPEKEIYACSGKHGMVYLLRRDCSGYGMQRTDCKPGAFIRKASGRGVHGGKRPAIHQYGRLSSGKRSRDLRLR